MLGRMASGALSQQRPARLDRHLERAVRGLLAHDDRVRGLDVHVDFAGGVAHLTGKVGSVDRLNRLRGLIGELAGVFALWSRPWGFGNSLEWPRWFATARAGSRSTWRRAFPAPVEHGDPGCGSSCPD